MNQKLTDKCFLFFYCMASLFLIRGDSSYIPFCFLAVGCSSLYSAFPELPLSWLFYPPGIVFSGSGLIPAADLPGF